MLAESGDKLRAIRHAVAVAVRKLDDHLETLLDLCEFAVNDRVDLLLRHQVCKPQSGQEFGANLVARVRVRQPAH